MNNINFQVPERPSHFADMSQHALLQYTAASFDANTRVCQDVRTGKSWISFLNEFGDEELRVQHNHRFLDHVNDYSVFTYDGVALTDPHAKLGIEEAFSFAAERAKSLSLNSSF